LNSDYKAQVRLDKIDVWSIGCILLEIVTGVPLWFKYRCKLEVKGKTTLQLGYFSMANREYPKMIKKQKELSENIGSIVFVSDKFEKYRDILKITLQSDANKRVRI
jgi:dual specificity tyrosine-phosphorylation-regulated kinase 2/3/4